MSEKAIEPSGTAKSAKMFGAMTFVRLAIFCLGCSVSIPRSSMAGINVSLGGTPSSLGTARTVAQLWALAVSPGMATVMRVMGTKAAFVGVVAVGALGTFTKARAASVWTLYAGIFFEGTNVHAMTVGKTIIANAVASDELPAQFGKTGMIAAFSFVGGPTLSICLIQTVGSRHIFTASCSIVICALCIAISLKGTGVDIKDVDSKCGDSATSLSASKVVLQTIICAFCTFAHSIVLFGLDLYLVPRFNMTASGIAGVMVSAALTFAASQGFLFAKLHKRLGSTSVLLSCGIASVIPLLVIDNVYSVPLWIALLLCSIVAMACLQPSTEVLLVEMTSPDKSRGTAWASTIQSFNNSVSPIASGFLVAGGFPLFRIAGAICFIGVVLQFLVVRRGCAKTKLS